MLRAFLCLVPVALCLAQTPPPAFEVASIKPMNIGNTGVHWNSDPGRIKLENMAVRNIIAAAYSLGDSQVSGPAWLDNTRYTIEAKADEKANEKRMLLMLQTLLADRFKLAAHRETRQASGYALVVAKGGLKIHPSAAPAGDSSSHGTGNKLTVSNLPMAALASRIERIVKLPVADETHTTVGYDFTLEYDRTLSQEPLSDDTASATPSIFRALTEQLGLKLEPRKVPVEMLIVDRCERPTEN
jgi:uncharacterized protein (TIGR03435 family)